MSKGARLSVTVAGGNASNQTGSDLAPDFQHRSVDRGGQATCWLRSRGLQLQLVYQNSGLTGKRATALSCKDSNCIVARKRPQTDIQRPGQDAWTAGLRTRRNLLTPRKLQRLCTTGIPWAFSSSTWSDGWLATWRRPGQVGPLEVQGQDLETTA